MGRGADEKRTGSFRRRSFLELRDNVVLEFVDKMSVVCGSRIPTSLTFIRMIRSVESRSSWRLSFMDTIR